MSLIARAELQKSSEYIAAVDSFLDKLYAIEDCGIREEHRRKIIEEDTLNLESIKYVDCLPSEIGALIYLKIIRIVDSRFGALPEELWTLTNLEELMIESWPLNGLSEKIKNLKNLQTFSIYVENFKTLPEELGKLPNLRSLTVTGDRVKQLPASIWTLPKLEQLSVSSEKLVALPPDLGNLSMLRTLELNRCTQLTRLPKEITKLKLQRLAIPGTPITATSSDTMWGCMGLRARFGPRFEYQKRN